MNLDNQTSYWNKVARSKTFTHPLDLNFLGEFLSKDSLIIDFGCGYGRIVEQLNNNGFTNLKGFDTSIELINRGNKDVANIFHIQSPGDIPVEDNTADCILLFAVLTCIPGNKAQKDLIHLLESKLKPGGLLYISDYYLQNDSAEMESYGYLNEDKNNFGVFTLEEGVTFRHHTKEWISELLEKFTILDEKQIEVITMNGQKAKAFQLLLKK
jgi:SAM-dependent methyltransferase